MDILPQHGGRNHDQRNRASGTCQLTWGRVGAGWRWPAAGRGARLKPPGLWHGDRCAACGIRALPSATCSKDGRPSPQRRSPDIPSLSRGCARPGQLREPLHAGTGRGVYGDDGHPARTGHPMVAPPGRETGAGLGLRRLVGAAGGHECRLRDGQRPHLRHSLSFPAGSADLWIITGHLSGGWAWTMIV